MNYVLLIILGVCIKIAASTDCGKPTDLSFDSLECCFKAWDGLDIYDDPCFHDGGANSYECMLDCFYKRNGMLINGTIVVENGKKYLQNFKNPRVYEMFSRAFEQCDKFGWDELKAKFGHLVLSKIGDCSPNACIFDSCIALNVIYNCPQEILEKSDYCKSQIGYLKECVFNS